MVNLKSLLRSFGSDYHKKKVQQERIDAFNTAINFAKEKFSFLNYYGYTLTESDAPPTYYNHYKNYVLYYESADKLIELALRKSGDNVSCVIRQKIGSEFARYNDKINCIGVYRLKYLQTGVDYDTFKFWGFDLKARLDVIDTYANLLLNHKDAISGNNWFDVNIIEANEEKEREGKYGKRKGPVQLSVEDELTQRSSFLLDAGYHIIEDSELLPPYSNLGWHIIFSNGTDIIKIHKVDWRDFYYLFAITKNNVEIFSTQVEKGESVKDMANRFISVLKTVI